MKKILPLFIISILSVTCLKAQVPLVDKTESKKAPPKEKFSDRMFFGGFIGLQFGTYTYIELSPIVGYEITPRLLGGIGLKYQYLEYNDDYSSYSSNTYGGGPFARFTVFNGLFLHADYEILSLEVPNLYYTGYYRETIYSLFLGAGYRQMLGSRSSMDFLIKYNVTESTYSPYQNPMIQIGFGFGL
jgi:hypothetical protein